MAVKLRMRVGDIEVEYEGAEAFLTKRVLGLITELSQVGGPACERAPTRNSSVSGNGAGRNGDPGPLASFLNAKDAKKKQVTRFLATAQWLHLKGSERVATRDVVDALHTSNQSRLGNPSDCLNKNVGRGYCVKEGRQFVVTDDGRKSLA